MNQEVTTLKNNDQILYLDMDGVIVDFDKAYSKLAGGKSLQANSLAIGEKPARDKFLKAGTKFWSEMEWIQGGKELISTAEKHFSNVWILSSAGTINSKLAETVIQGKLEWLAKHIPSIPMSKVIVVLGRHRKKDYAVKNAILVDDMRDTIESWNVKGGNGILHDYRFYKNSIDALECLSQSK